jgi:hypothetical protein
MFEKSFLSSLPNCKTNNRSKTSERERERDKAGRSIFAVDSKSDVSRNQEQERAFFFVVHLFFSCGSVLLFDSRRGIPRAKDYSSFWHYITTTAMADLAINNQIIKSFCASCLLFSHYLSLCCCSRATTPNTMLHGMLTDRYSIDSC